MFIGGTPKGGTDKNLRLPHYPIAVPKHLKLAALVKSDPNPSG